MSMGRIANLTLILLTMASVVMAEDSFDPLVSFDQKNIPIHQEQMRKLSGRIRLLEGGVSLTTGVNGILPLANGGTAVALVDPGADRILFWDESENKFAFLTAGSGLTISTTSISVTGQIKSNVLFQYSAQVENQGTSVGEYVGSSLVPSAQTGNYRFLQVASQDTTFGTIWATKWVKEADIDTILVMAQVWTRTDGGTGDARAVLKVDVGGQNAQVNGTLGQLTPEWVTISSIDVSSLSDGTAYDVTVSLANADNDANQSYMGNLIAFGT